MLGERASADIVREGTDFAEVEASVAPDDEHPIWHTTYDETANPTLKGSFSDILDPSDTVILARRITSSGRSRCQVNGRLVNLKHLQALGTLLVDIHGQHEHQSLFRTQTHLKLLDDFGGNSEAQRHIGKIYAQLRTLQQEAASLAETLKASEREKELLEFEIKELTAANLEEGEDETLADEARLLKHAEALRESASKVYHQLENEGSGMGTSGSPLERVKAAAKELIKLSDIDNSLSELADRLESSLYELEDIASQVRYYAETVESNALRLEEVTDRLALISKLKRRYGNSIPGDIGLPRGSRGKIRDVTTRYRKTGFAPDRNPQNNSRSAASMHSTFRETAACREASFRTDRKGVTHTRYGQSGISSIRSTYAG